MARVSMQRIRQRAAKACEEDPNPASCRRGVSLALQAYREERKRKSKPNPEAARRLAKYRRCAQEAGVAPFTKPTAEQKRMISACMSR